MYSLGHYVCWLTHYQMSISAPRRVLCTCRSYCTTYNTETGTYEGSGFFLPVTTKWNHAQADKLERREQKLRASEHSCTSTSNLTGPGSLGGGTDSTIALIKEEIQWLSRLPFTQLGTLLHFIHDPIHHGDFNWPSEEDMAVPNRGLYALSGELRCNSAFILAEHRCCLLLWRVRTELKSSAVTDDLIDLIFDELSRLNRRKKADWTQR